MIGKEGVSVDIATLAERVRLAMATEKEAHRVYSEAMRQHYDTQREWSQAVDNVRQAENDLIVAAGGTDRSFEYNITTATTTTQGSTLPPVFSVQDVEEGQG